MKCDAWPVILPVLFLVYTLPLFLRVFATTQSVIDEEFHLRQGLHFCNKRFDVWDNKITTFPGLYLVSLILNPLNLCSVLGLRLISLAAATANIVLMYKIRLLVVGRARGSLAALDAIILAALPPLYFFAHLYYTDVLSLTTVLLFYYYWQREMHLKAAVYAAASVLVRQTNVVWVSMVFGVTCLNELVKNYAVAKNMKINDVNLFKIHTWLDILTSYKVLLKSVWTILRKCCYYIVIILPFVGFVFLNGSIVLGDKRAHEATLHIPQMFYFAVFAMLFGVMNTLQNVKSTLLTVLNNKVKVLLFVGICLAVIHWNTHVHPYLLADNRHYIFYVWNRFYGRYAWFKYCMAPIYVIALLLLYQGINHKSDAFKMMFWLAVGLVLCFQRLLEIRYFLTPFVLFRLNMRTPPTRHMHQWIELAFYIAINAIVYYVFFTKEIKWKDFAEPQRIIW